MQRENQTIVGDSLRSPVRVAWDCPLMTLTTHPYRYGTGRTVELWDVVISQGNDRVKILYEDGGDIGSEFMKPMS